MKPSCVHSVPAGRLVADVVDVDDRVVVSVFSVVLVDCVASTFGFDVAALVVDSG